MTNNISTRNSLKCQILIKPLQEFTLQSNFSIYFRGNSRNSVILSTRLSLFCIQYKIIVKKFNIVKHLHFFSCCTSLPILYIFSDFVITCSIQIHIHPCRYFNRKMLHNFTYTLILSTNSKKKTCACSSQQKKTVTKHIYTSLVDSYL